MKIDSPAGSPNQSGFSWFAGWRGALTCLALLVFVFFSRFLLTGRFFLMRDLIFDFFAREQFYKNHLLHGVLPLWNPYTGGGEPFLPNMESAVFYPPNLLYLIFPVPNANVILAALHFFLAGFGVWLACRAWRISRQGSLLAAVAFAFGTQMTTRIKFPSFLSSLSWFPLAVALYTLWLKRPSLKKFLLLAMVMSLQLFGGYPEVVLFTSGTLLLYTLMVGRHAALAGKGGSSRTGLAFLGLLGMGAVAILLSLAQILPVLNIIPLSARTAQDPLVGQASINPAMWLTAFYPYLYGVPGHFGRYWAPAVHEFWMGTFYVGLLPVMLCLTATIRRSLTGRKSPKFTDDPVARLRTPFLLVILFFFMLYAMGSYTPFFGLLWKMVLPLRWFRWPGKALMVVSFALSCLGGIALDWLATPNDAQCPARSAWRKRLADYGPLGLWLALALGAGISLLDHGSLGKWLLRSHFNLGQVTDQYAHRIPWVVLSDQCLKFIGVTILSAILLQILVFKPARRRATFGAMLLVLFTDLWLTSFPLLPSSNLDIMHNGSDYKKLFRSGKLDGRIYQMFSQQWLYGVTNEHLIRLARDTMIGYWPMVDKVESVNPGGDFKLRNYMDLLYEYEFGVVPEPYKTKILKLLGTSYILESALKPGYFEGEEVLTPQLFPIQGALPDAVVVGRAEGFATRVGLLKALVFGDHDLAKVALLDSGDLAQLPPLGRQDSIDHQIIDYANRRNGLTVKVKSAEPGLLVINATFYPSWRATVNGNPTPIYQANGPFRAIEIPAGVSVVEMDYHPTNMVIGLYLSLGGLALVLGLFFLPEATILFRRPKPGL